MGDEEHHEFSIEAFTVQGWTVSQSAMHLLCVALVFPTGAQLKRRHKWLMVIASKFLENSEAIGVSV